MARMASYTKQENQVLPEYRQRVNTAEAREDVHAAFARMLRMLLTQILGEPVRLEEGDVALDPASEAGYRLGPGITGKPEFSELWSNSDLDAILRRQAAMAVNRCRRLEAGPEASDFKDRRTGRR